MSDMYERYLYHEKLSNLGLSDLEKENMMRKPYHTFSGENLIEKQNLKMKERKVKNNG